MGTPHKKGYRARATLSTIASALGPLKKLADTLALDLANVGPAIPLLEAYAVGDITALCSWAVPYSDMDVHHVRLCRQLQALFQKRDDLNLGFDRRARALGKFWDSEELCSQTNALFRMRARGQVSLLRGVESILFSASRKIARMLGDAPSLTAGNFTPGATTCTKKKNSHPLIKMEAGLACSGNLAPSILDANELVPNGWLHGLSSDSGIGLRVHPGVLETVPKKYDVDRVIVKEPVLNGIFQQYIGAVMINRLRASGLNLRDQEASKEAARTAVANDLATLDLSSASDTIARWVVADLFPGDWLELFELTRTQCVAVDGNPVHLEKFSSMGNGFTFPLESVLFYALTWACAESVDPLLTHDVKVYGDDIIVHKRVVPVLLEVLRTTGFLVNSEKSYWDGPFRESCGGDYLSGLDVRPTYLRGKPTRERLYTLFNGLMASPLCAYADHVLDAIPHNLRVWGPPDIGDCVLVDYSFQKKVTIDKNGWERVPIKAWVTQVKEVRHDADSPLLGAYALYMAESSVGPLETRWRLQRGVAQYDEYPMGPKTHRYDRKGQFWITVPGKNLARIQTIYITA